MTEVINNYKKMVGNGEINEISKKNGLMYEDPLLNYDINKIMEPYFKSNNFIGTYVVNTIENINTKSLFSFISNILPLSKKIGHWIVVYVNNDNIEYYDPFGQPSDKKIKDALKKLLNKAFNNQPRKKITI